MKYVIKYLRDYKKECVFAPLFKMLEALFELFVPLVIAAVIDIGIHNRDVSYIIRMCLLLVGLCVVGLVCSITAQYFASKAAVSVATSLRHSLFEHIESLSFTEMDTMGSSTLITRMTSDVNQVQNGVNMVLRLFMRSPFIVCGAAIMAFRIDVKSAWIFVITIPVLSVIVFGIMLITKPMYKKIQQGLDKLLGIIRENLSGVRVIRAFHKEESELAQFKAANEALTSLQKHAGKISGLMNPITYIIINSAIMILIWVGAVRVNSGILTQGQVVALYNYMTQILIELIKLANLIITITKALACANRIADTFSQESSMQEGSWDGSAQSWENGMKTSGMQEGNIQGNNRNGFGRGSEYAVEFRGVSLTYQNAGGESLSGLTFQVKQGQTVGIIGGTGSGKSSLVNLIPRFYDATAGEVLVDGVNVREYTYEALGRKVSMVLQKAQLFQGSIRDNLLVGNGKAGEEELYRALRISQAADFVEEREGKLESMLEQGGRNLSGGQKQRLTIARAIVKGADILILDDSASALDYATDARLRKAIREMEPSPTVFIVSQRTSSILHADQIIVLENGQIAGIGTHTELLETCQVYQEIYYSQYQKEAAGGGR
ncbi:ABC-type multidrug transport system fused ATPase/permease subunit [Anaerotaenia torta]|uniref:ABC transporter ATP-binding protein n=1 Tax=Anaerotaenia torta TaxID=433293 RepID=UPI003D238C82